MKWFKVLGKSSSTVEGHLENMQKQGVLAYVNQVRKNKNLFPLSIVSRSSVLSGSNHKPAQRKGGRSSMSFFRGDLKNLERGSPVDEMLARVKQAYRKKYGDQGYSSFRNYVVPLFYNHFIEFYENPESQNAKERLAFYESLFLYIIDKAADLAGEAGERNTFFQIYVHRAFNLSLDSLDQLHRGDFGENLYRASSGNSLLESSIYETVAASESRTQKEFDVVGSFSKSWQEDSFESTTNDEPRRRALHDHFQKFMYEVLGNQLNAKFLDVGTGHFLIPRFMVEDFYQSPFILGKAEFHAIDPADVRMEFAPNDPRFSFKKISAEELVSHYPPHSFNAITSMTGIEYAKDLSLALAAVNQVSAMGAQFASIFHHRESSISQTSKRELEEAELIEKTRLFEYVNDYLNAALNGNQVAADEATQMVIHAETQVRGEAIRNGWGTPSLVRLLDVALPGVFTLESVTEAKKMWDLTLTKNQEALDLKKYRLDKVAIYGEANRQELVQFLEAHGFKVEPLKRFVTPPKDKLMGWNILMKKDRDVWVSDILLERGQVTEAIQSLEAALLLTEADTEAYRVATEKLKSVKSESRISKVKKGGSALLKAKEELLQALSQESNLGKRLILVREYIQKTLLRTISKDDYFEFIVGRRLMKVAAGNGSPLTSRLSLRNWELNTRTPSPAYIKTIASFAGIDPSWILWGKSLRDAFADTNIETEAGVRMEMARLYAGLNKTMLKRHKDFRFKGSYVINQNEKRKQPEKINPDYQENLSEISSIDSDLLLWGRSLRDMLIRTHRLSERLRIVRLYLGLTKAQLARDLDIPVNNVTSITEYEAGEIEPSYNYVVALAQKATKHAKKFLSARVTKRDKAEIAPGLIDPRILEEELRKEPNRGRRLRLLRKALDPSQKSFIQRGMPVNGRDIAIYEKEGTTFYSKELHHYIEVLSKTIRVNPSLVDFDYFKRKILLTRGRRNRLIDVREALGLSMSELARLSDGKVSIGSISDAEREENPRAPMPAHVETLAKLSGLPPELIDPIRLVHAIRLLPSTHERIKELHKRVGFRSGPDIFEVLQDFLNTEDLPFSYHDIYGFERPDPNPDMEVRRTLYVKILAQFLEIHPAHIHPPVLFDQLAATDSVGERFQMVRNFLGFSFEELSRQLKAIGISISSDSLQGYENGRSRFETEAPFFPRGLAQLANIEDHGWIIWGQDTQSALKTVPLPERLVRLRLYLGETTKTITNGPKQGMWAKKVELDISYNRLRNYESGTGYKSEGYRHYIEKLALIAEQSPHSRLNQDWVLEILDPKRRESILEEEKRTEFELIEHVKEVAWSQIVSHASRFRNSPEDVWAVLLSKLYAQGFFKSLRTAPNPTGYILKTVKLDLPRIQKEPISSQEFAFSEINAGNPQSEGIEKRFQASNAPTVLESSVTDEELRLLDKALHSPESKLTQVEKQTIEWIYFDGLDISEVALKFQLTLDKVADHLSKAHEKLRESLTSDSKTLRSESRTERPAVGTVLRRLQQSLLNGSSEPYGAPASSSFQDVDGWIRESVQSASGIEPDQFDTILDTDDESTQKLYRGIIKYVPQREFFEQHKKKLNKLSSKKQQALLRYRFGRGWSLKKIREHMQREYAVTEAFQTGNTIAFAFFNFKRKVDPQFHFLSSAVIYEWPPLKTLEPLTLKILLEHVPGKRVGRTISEIAYREDLSEEEVQAQLQLAETHIREGMQEVKKIKIEIKDKTVQFYEQHKQYVKYLLPAERTVLKLVFEKGLRDRSEIKKRLMKVLNKRFGVGTEIKNAVAALRTAAREDYSIHMIESRREKDPAALKKALAEVYQDDWFEKKETPHPAHIVQALFPAKENKIPSTLTKLGETLGVTKERVRQLKNDALFRLARYWKVDLKDLAPIYQNSEVWEPALEEALKSSYEKYSKIKGQQVLMEGMDVFLPSDHPGSMTHNVLASFVWAHLPTMIKKTADSDYRTALQDFKYRVQEVEKKGPSFKIRMIAYQTVLEVLTDIFEKEKKLPSARALSQHSRIQLKGSSFDDAFQDAVRHIEKHSAQFYPNL